MNNRKLIISSIVICFILCISLIGLNTKSIPFYKNEKVSFMQDIADNKSFDADY